MKVKISKNPNKNVLDYLREHNIHISALCGGKGTCGKCRVRVNQELCPPDEQEQKVLGDTMISQGYRLACKIQCEEDFEIELDQEQETFRVVSVYDEEDYTQKTMIHSPNADYGIAMDIGTTTLVMELIDLATKETVDRYTALNSGRRYGADVIARIDYVNKNGGIELQALMKQDLLQGIQIVCNRNNLSIEAIKRIIIAGNTTMLHLLTGADCSGLGVYPFTAEFLDQKRISLQKLLGLGKLCGEAILLPGLSTYVGADIVSGILKCQMHRKESVQILIDIGTNGEMVIGNNEKLLSLATAAGPAFEGGNIRCGTGSIEGAISSAYYKEGLFELGTIGEKPPVGICGSGLIDLVAECLNHELIDETGLIEGDLDELSISRQGNIVLTQKDIRQFQLAKSAIRAGLEILMKHYGVTSEQVETVYLAGGFGKFIDLEHALEIGLLPRGFKNKIKRVGNVALGGAREYLIDKSLDQEIELIKDISQNLNLANSPEFNTYFVEHMLFEEA